MEYDVAIVGAGIVGLATARALLANQSLRIVVLEAEEEIAAHQTGNNSGVIHSGLYYRAGSLKARNCMAGREAMYGFCEQEGIAHERCGKLVLATDEAEVERLSELERRGRANGLGGLAWLDAEQIADYEPRARGLAALWVPQTGIVDYRQVSRRIAEQLIRDGAEIRTRHRVTGVNQPPDGIVIETNQGEARSRFLVNCAGLHSDVIARLCGARPGLRIVPFRGEYYALVEDRWHLVRNLIYPVPDPRFPFLGVHFTRMIDGGVEAGPNAVLAFSRHGYRWSNVSPADMASMGSYVGFWRMAGHYWQTGLHETIRSLSKRRFVRALQKLVPELEVADVERHGAGVRAQAVEPDGSLVDDFRIIQSKRMIHVLNAPSPAATAAFSIGQAIAAKLLEAAE